MTALPARIWRAVVRLVGGFYDIGPASIVVHDRGIIFCWRRVVKWEVCK